MLQKWNGLCSIWICRGQFNQNPEWMRQLHYDKDSLLARTMQHWKTYGKDHCNIKFYLIHFYAIKQEFHRNRALSALAEAQTDLSRICQISFIAWYWECPENRALLQTGLIGFLIQQVFGVPQSNVILHASIVNKEHRQLFICTQTNTHSHGRHNMTRLKQHPILVILANVVAAARQYNMA